MFYSASKGGFYPAEMRSEYEASGSWPTDAVEIGKEKYTYLMMGQDVGKRIDADEAGMPYLADIPPESLESILSRSLSDVRKQRAPILTTLDGIAGRMYRAGDLETAQAADKAINALLDITKLPELANARTYDDVKAIVLAKYRQIASEAPDVVRSAFLEVATS